MNKRWWKEPMHSGGGLRVPYTWKSVYKKVEGTAHPHQPCLQVPSTSIPLWIWLFKVRISYITVIILPILLALTPPSLTGQTPTIPPADIETFARILLQTSTQPFDISDLTDKNFTIYWLHPDRRASRDFHKRISSYTGDQYTNLQYRWSWPDSLPSGENQFNILIFSEDMTWPDRWIELSNAFRIRIGSSSPPSGFTGLMLPDARSGFMDLAAQYIMKGITVDEGGKITSGERISYLPASYLGLDEAYLTNQLDSILQLGLDSMAYPGAEVRIAYNGSVIYQKTVGHHTYDRKYLVRSHDLYDLASLTKVTAGVNALMTMYENGQFDLNKSLGDYFPYFRNSDKGPLGMKRILTHSAGLTPYMVYYSMARKDNGRYQRHTLSSARYGDYQYPVTDSIFVSNRFSRFIYKAIKDSPLEPGHKYKYSGLFFLLIPDLVREQTGSPLDQYLYHHIFSPLGAHSTVFNPSPGFNIHRIVPTEIDQVWRHQLVHGGVHDEAAAVLGGVSANAGLFSTGIDLIKIGETWRRKGAYGGKRYWSEETIETFTRCYYCDEGNRRALGFDRPPLPDQPANSYMSPLASQQSFGHSGFTGTMIWVDPAVDYTFVFLSNRVHPTRENTKIYSLNIRPALHSVLYKALK